MRGSRLGGEEIFQTLLSCGPEPIGGRTDLSGQQLLLETDELSGVWLDQV